MEVDEIEAVPDADGPSWRTKLLVAFVVVAVGAYVATRPAGSTEFQASGTPRPLPPAGELTAATAEQFEGILVGLRGTPVIVNVWASWCSPCRTETPLLERTWRAHGGDVVVVGVASKDVASNSRSFMEEFDVTFPNVFDESGKIRARLGLRGFPTTFVFGADGAVRTTIVGGLTEQRLAAVLEDLGV